MLHNDDYRKVSIVQLRKLCKLHKIPNFSRLKKNELFLIVNKCIASRLIQKVYRNHFYKNAVDFITLDPVGYPCFVFKLKEGKFVYYSYTSIIPYIIKTGDVKEPTTRIIFGDTDLKRLDTEAKHWGYRYRSTYKIKKNSRYTRQIRSRQNEIMFLELRIREISAIMETIVENNVLTWDITESFQIDGTNYGSVRIYINELCAEFRLCVRNLLTYDRESSIILFNRLKNKLEIAKNNNSVNNISFTALNYALQSIQFLL